MADPNYIDAFIRAYTASYANVPQERKNIFDGSVMTTPLSGEQMAFDDIGILSMKKKTTRFADVTYDDPDFRRRWLFPEWYYNAILVDKQDNIAMHTDPTSAFIQNLTFAIERKKRDVILAAFEATVSGGKNPGDTTFAFDADDIAAADGKGRTIRHDTTNSGEEGGTSTGLTVEKLILVRETFSTLGIPDGVPIKFVCSFRQISDLLREAETQSIDTSAVKALVEGKISRYMGIDFLVTNAVTLGTNNDLDGDTNVFKCFAWIPEGIKFAQHLSPSFRVDYLPEKVGETWQIKADFGCNAIRMHEDMVLKVECANV